MITLKSCGTFRPAGTRSRRIVPLQSAIGGGITDVDVPEACERRTLRRLDLARFPRRTSEPDPARFDDRAPFDIGARADAATRLHHHVVGQLRAHADER